MFGFKSVAVEELEGKIKSLEMDKKYYSDLSDARYKEFQQEREKHAREIENIKEDFASEKRIYENEAHIEVNEAITRQKEINAELSAKNQVLTKEVEILNKAFENMGFDVKDTKEIISDLVKGISTKNTVQVIK